MKNIFIIDDEEKLRDLLSVASIPKERKFQEKILSFSIQIDGALANAWMNSIQKKYKSLRS